mmetsp:Transcript_19486/g.74779  ORF Transcript_19486/g.74779 Transcript_19486/m.74779 type:complete len:229 (-) Transcript_19486:33-719(-)
MATQWDDIQARIGNRPAAQVTYDQEAFETLVAVTAQAKGMDLRSLATVEELDELIDEEKEEDEEAELQRLRKKRIEELKRQAARDVYGFSKEIGHDDFVDEVSQASKECDVLALIYLAGAKGSDIIHELFGRVARLHKDVKFVTLKERNDPSKIPAGKPCLVVHYRGAEPVRSYRPDPREIRSEEEFEWSLAQKKMVKTELEEDPRTNQPNRVVVNIRKNIAPYSSSA